MLRSVSKNYIYGPVLLEPKVQTAWQHTKCSKLTMYIFIIKNNSYILKVIGSICITHMENQVNVNKTLSFCGCDVRVPVMFVCLWVIF